MAEDQLNKKNLKGGSSHPSIHSLFPPSSVVEEDNIESRKDVGFDMYKGIRGGLCE